MALTESSQMVVGQVSVEATQNFGHPPEFYAERILERLIYISENAPPEIRAQALAYRESMKQTLLAGIKRAILSNHTTIINQLRKAGMTEAAELVYRLRE